MREFPFLAPLRFVLRGDRRDHPPFGFGGGQAGAPSAHLLLRAEAKRSLCPTMPMASVEARAGDVFRLIARAAAATATR